LSKYLDKLLGGPLKILFCVYNNRDGGKKKL
jgi:hypothetical protein